MKGLEKLDFLTKEQLKLLEVSTTNYKKFGRIFFKVQKYDEQNKEIYIKVWQEENNTKKYLTAKELIDRTKSVFNILPADLRMHVRPVSYTKDKIINYTIDDVRKDMLQYEIQPKDLVKLLDIDKTSISRLLNEDRELTKYQKAMFYYLFEYLKLKSGN